MDGFFWCLGYTPDIGVAWSHEMFVDAPLQLFKKWGIVIARIQDDDGFKIKTKLFPRDYFHQLLKRAATARQCYASVGEACYGLLALVHIARFNKSGETFMVPVLLYHKAWDDTRNFATGSQAGVSRGSHKSHVTSSIDDSYTATAQAMAQSACCGEKVFMYLGA